MVDIHSHILPNIDDGAKSIEETLKLIDEAINAGFTDIISTSHYMEGLCDANKSKRESIIKDVQKILDENGIDMRIHNGAECYISINTERLVKENIVPTLNNSRYILIEFPMNAKILFLENIIQRLFDMDLVPIIAHPERYNYVQKNPKILLSLIKKGVLFQANYGSITGVYGRQAKKTVEKLLKDKMIHILATDVHRQHTIYTNMGSILKALGKLVDDKYNRKLTQENPMKVLNDEVI